MKALISVYNKSGLLDFLKFMGNNIELIYATDGTFKYLSDNGIKAFPTSELTGFGDILDGRVKTLHPAIFSGLLSKRDLKSNNELKKYNYPDFDILISNLYPFSEAAKTGDLAKMIENIDIGGVSLIRAAAKNYKNVVVISDPDDYQYVEDEFNVNKEISMKAREYLALRAFSRAAVYDINIYNNLYQRLNGEEPDELFIHAYDGVKLRYGENPNQKGFMYRTEKKLGIPNAVQLNGKELSYNNILDANAALETVQDFDEPTSVIVKHRTPSGVASDASLSAAFNKSYNADPESAYGFVVAVNRKLDIETAREMEHKFIEVLIAPDYDGDALSLLKKKKNLRILRANMERDNSYAISSVSGGVLVQTRLNPNFESMDLKTEYQASEEQINDLKFAWKIVAHTKSNAMVLVKNKVSTGIGAGQTSRIEALKIAIDRAGDNASGSVMASDAFIPFDDSVIECHKHGITAIIEPGGSIRDADVINRANEYKMPLYFTNKRVFLH
ncbi:bifunctional phosphoribosylaminoimidazolecarboxamide formyltransferase/IMP cyclohydrolase [Acidiplasma aeolicum]|uniref:Phosphoribosylaminoimidazolecarboxamide formyltransferase n=1 Tax=Acidiplasma aeolicum TaxID=507754 RepID=A0A0Q0S035_9ARCH|nr:bifunctional phosphoribosylaminoimidazolecarboxamide formyltransferase/IMP cyclohydrolase [Acidiplasma aeolicum]KQB36249.1 phosphoribosylaminoimidazolecarboxamide formyltransferase [Acidiplasma aeolicum]